MASASPRQQQQQAVKAVASSCPTSPLQSGNNSKPDRTADFAAVRNLAESYGVALLPLEMGFTPLRTQRPKSAAAARLSTADSTTEHPNTPEVGENVAAAAAGRGLDQAYSASSTTGQHDTNDPSAARLLSPSKAGAAAPQPLQAAGGSGEAVGCFPIDVEEGSELNTESPSGMADFAEAGDGEGLYLYEDQLPMEERVTLLEVRAGAVAVACWDSVCGVMPAQARDLLLGGTTHRTNSNSVGSCTPQCSAVQDVPAAPLHAVLC
jgi:hypothetical protein